MHSDSRGAMRFAMRFGRFRMRRAMRLAMRSVIRFAMRFAMRFATTPACLSSHIARHAPALLTTLPLGLRRVVLEVVVDDEAAPGKRRRGVFLAQGDARLAR